MQGALILIVGLPGSGKGTLINHVRGAFPELVFPTSWTTRPIRAGEIEGQVYHFATEEEFSKEVADGAFLEWVTIDTGSRYGTLKREIIPFLESGKTVIREVEVDGARNIRSLLAPYKVVTIFISTDSWEVLRERMLARAPMSEEELAERKKRYEREVLFKAEADFVVENRNGELESAEQALDTIISRILGK